jgi:hypothetical protein
VRPGRLEERFSLGMFGRSRSYDKLVQFQPTFAGNRTKIVNIKDNLTGKTHNLYRYGVLSVLRKLRNLALFHVQKQLGESLILSKLDYIRVLCFTHYNYTNRSNYRKSKMYVQVSC